MGLNRHQWRREFLHRNNENADGITAIVPGTRPDWDGGYEDSHRIPQEELGRKLGEAEISSYWFKKGLALDRARIRERG